LEVAEFGDAPTADVLDVGVPGDAEPVAGASAGVQLTGLEPVVDDASAAPELAGGLGDAELPGGVGVRG
jgi:hypothetical protein